ncbi:MAG: hypothetical protein ACHQJ6_04620 [Candidatus Berkiellales bacterium]
MSLATLERQGPVIVELTEEKDSLALVPAAGALVQPENQLARVPQGYDCLVSHANVMKTAAAAAFVGTQAGGILARAAAPEIAQEVSTNVQAAVKRIGDEMTQAVLKETGLGKIPGAAFLVKAEVTDLAHQAGEQAYQQTMTAVTAKGAALGGAATGAATVLALEAVNALTYLAKTYITPRITAYYNQRRQQQLALMSQQQLNKDIAEGKFKSTLDSDEVESDDETLDGFINLKKKNHV